MKLLFWRKKKETYPKLPNWHHDFLTYPARYIKTKSKMYKVWHQPYKDIWIIFWVRPTPEDLKMAQDDFDSKYPDCEECEKTLFICTCMLELEGFTA